MSVYLVYVTGKAEGTLRQMDSGKWLWRRLNDGRAVFSSDLTLDEIRNYIAKNRDVQADSIDFIGLQER